jgi:hypothetical protein
MATSTFERLLEDDVVHEQLTVAAARLRDAIQRAGKLPPRRAVQDKKLYDQVREAVAAATLAARRLTGRDKPVPKRRGRRLVLAVAAGAVAGAVAHRRTHRPPTTA